MSKDTEKCIHFLKKKYALDFTMYENSFLEKGIGARMAATACKTMDDYLLLIDSQPNEYPELFNQLTNSYSKFFRNPLTFAYLEQLILPELIGQKIKNNEKEIRIWSAACASGQEAYSVAILCDELIKMAKTTITFRIFATDINQCELVNAQNGVYTTASLGNVSLKRIQTYFINHGETYTIDPRLRDSIDFSIFDLFDQYGRCPPVSVYGNFDLIFCSNLLFYYQPEYRRQILNKTLHCLASDGFLITGETERDIVRENNYREVFVNSGIFQRKIK